MFKHVRLLLAAALAVAAVVGGGAAQEAAASSFAITPAGAITSASLGKLTFTAAEVRIACNVTLVGTLDRGSKAMTAGTQFGSITGVRWSSCEGGEITTALALPWRMTYGSILGTLPERATGTLFKIANGQLQFSAFGGFVTCLYSGEIGALLELTNREGSRYRAGLNRVLEAERFRLVSGGLCPAEGHMAGRFGLSPAQTMIVEPRPARLRADPAALTIRRIENDGIVRLTNTGDLSSTQTIEARSVRGRFEVSATGCESAVAGAGGTCSIVITAEDRPAEGRLTIEYEDADRNRGRVTADITIEA